MQHAVCGGISTSDKLLVFALRMTSLLTPFGSTQQASHERSLPVALVTRLKQVLVVQDPQLARESDQREDVVRNPSYKSVFVLEVERAAPFIFIHVGRV